MKKDYDADYDRWGRTPGSIRVVKAPKKKTTKPSTAKKRGKK